MRASFFGFEAVRKALMASQKGLDVTGQNVSNVNTQGYTRQRIDLGSLSLDTAYSRYAKSKGDCVGQGVEILSIDQTRDKFIDARYRSCNADSGRWDTKVSVLSDIENILDETSTDGLHARLNDVFSKLQGFSINPESIEFASIFRSSVQKLNEIFNQYSTQLDDLTKQNTFNLDISVTEINNTIEKIAQLNNLIKGEVVQGQNPNELNDSRNLLLDKLSNLCGASFEFLKDGGVSVKIDGKYLLDSDKYDKTNFISLNSSSEPIKITWADGSNANITKGQIAGYLETLNGKGKFALQADTAKQKTSGIPYYKTSIDKLALIIADTFNNINDNTGSKKLFVGDSFGVINAATIKLSDEWLNDAQYITKSTLADAAPGNNDNLLRMVDSMNAKHNITSRFSGTFEEYMASVIGDIAIEVKDTQDMSDSSSFVLDTISNQRESMMGVSIDEEAINMVKYQKSYNAAARLMTVMDDALDTLINKMGTVGR
jgi:flagellar hook-associated protein 1